ncbi:MAG: phosphatidylserine/phosphatidylglycerophosphate/cardiolipin synthase family protein [Deltaproteobacteria bacterium]|nr:phosphatidylserine/phosphatidylglycerophosphate/cardiolipin synthase family protein [Deltaproteobacteria bacterium]
MSGQPERQPDQTGIPDPILDAPSRAVPVALPAIYQRYARSLARWRPGCEVTVLRDGDQVFPAMLAAMAAAKRSICLETYILAADTTGERFKSVLIERARAGVKVRVIYDAVGSFSLPATYATVLRDAGCEVVEFNPIAPWRARFRLSHRDHRKILVVDDEVGFTGGLNIANEYAAVADGGAGWHDMHCQVHGTIVIDLARMFRRTWLRAGGERYRPPRPAKDSQAPGPSFVRLLDNGRIRTRATVRRAYLHVIKAARTSVLIENAYFLPDRGLRRALALAVRRGVDVRIVVPGRSDVKIIEWASLYVMRRLAKRGIKILRWRGVMMHAKTATIDTTWSTIGSYNFDAQSRFNNLEVTLEILDPEVGTTLAKSFERDVANCEPFDEATWLGLSWWRKALAWFGFRFRRFL